VIEIAGSVGTMKKTYHALFLCTGNSARSIMAEAILNRLALGRVRAYSAGSHPKNHPHPMALATPSERGYDTSNLRSKSWQEFAQPSAPSLDFVFTVCAKAAGETCPLWAGPALTAHWGVEDPVAFEGTEDEQRSFFRRTCGELEKKIDRFTKLDLDSLDRSDLRSRLSEIGKNEPRATEGA
jgi:protein-tyrosine-phosphatase